MVHKKFTQNFFIVFFGNSHPSKLTEPSILASEKSVDHAVIDKKIVEKMKGLSDEQRDAVYLALQQFFLPFEKKCNGFLLGKPFVISETFT